MSLMQYPIFYHPTNVLLLDDDRKFLNLIASGLDDKFPFVIQDNANKTLDYLTTHVLHPSDLSQLIAKQTFDKGSDKSFFGNEDYTIDLRALKGDLLSPERFKKVLAVVVDRRMPSMDGLEFCKKIRQNLKLPVKLILLTGVTTVDEAVNAFNDGIIDAFIEKKPNENTITTLNQTIQDLVWGNFSELSQKLIGLIEPQLRHIFDDRYYMELEKVRNEHKIIEFFLLDSSGSFLLLDSEGKTKIFFARTDEDFESMYDIAKDSEAMRDVLQGLRDRQQFPYSSSGTGHLSLKGDEWNPIMVTMNKIPGREVFYSVLDTALFDTFSFQKYKNEVWPAP